MCRLLDSVVTFRSTGRMIMPLRPPPTGETYFEGRPIAALSAERDRGLLYGGASTVPDRRRTVMGVFDTADDLQAAVLELGD